MFTIFISFVMHCMSCNNVFGTCCLLLYTYQMFFLYMYALNVLYVYMSSSYLSFLFIQCLYINEYTDAIIGTW